MPRLQPSQLTPELEELLAKSQLKHYETGEYIVRAGEKPTALYFLLDGSVTVYIEDENGKELILAYLAPGSFFGELGLFDDADGRSAWVRGRKECEVASINYDTFLDLCRQEPKLWMQLTKQIANRLRETSRNMGQLAFLDVTGRVARRLLDLAADSEAITHPDGMMVSISREELGRLVSCSREMASKVLHALEKQGLIQIDGRKIVIHETR